MVSVTWVFPPETGLPPMTKTVPTWADAALAVSRLVAEGPIPPRMQLVIEEEDR